MTDLLYTDVEEDLRASVRGVVERRLGPDRVAAVYDAPETDFSPLWKELAQELGLSGLLVPEELDGVGAGLREAAVVVEELGRAVAPVPFLNVIVVVLVTVWGFGAILMLARDVSSDRTHTRMHQSL